MAIDASGTLFSVPLQRNKSQTNLFNTVSLQAADSDTTQKRTDAQQHYIDVLISLKRSSIMH